MERYIKFALVAATAKQPHLENRRKKRELKAVSPSKMSTLTNASLILKCYIVIIIAVVVVCACACI